MHYPLDDLIAILALESERNRCLVIGEDLGTVPEAMTVAMEHYRVYHYKVLLFEQEPNGRFKPPDRRTCRLRWRRSRRTICRRCAAGGRSTTSRCATGWICIRARSSRCRRTRRARRTGASCCWRWWRQDLWHWSPEQPLPAYSPALVARGACLSSACRAPNIAMIQIEDLIGMTDPVNVPGTDTEHPNWQRKVHAGLAR